MSSNKYTKRLAKCNGLLTCTEVYLLRKVSISACKVSNFAIWTVVVLREHGIFQGIMAQNLDERARSTSVILDQDRNVVCCTESVGEKSRRNFGIA